MMGIKNMATKVGRIRGSSTVVNTLFNFDGALLVFEIRSMDERA